MLFCFKGHVIGIICCKLQQRLNLCVHCLYLFVQQFNYIGTVTLEVCQVHFLSFVMCIIEDCCHL
jgi:hypothetical protein